MNKTSGLIQSIRLFTQLLPYVSCFPLQFLCALAASYFLYYRKKHSQVFFICWICFNPLAFIFTNDHLPNKGRFWCLKKHPLSISSFSMQQWEEQLRTILQASWSNKTISTFKKLSFNLEDLTFCWFLFPGARPNKSWMSDSTRLFQYLIRTPFLIAERNMYAITAKLSKENNVFNATY